jgi:hypothetical protein
MTAEEYAAAQAAISAAQVSVVLQLAAIFQPPMLSLVDWERFLDLLFPYVEDARRQSAELGRRFYDAQREQHGPDLPRHDVPIVGYRREWFSDAMEAARHEFSRPGASEHALARVALRAVREVENGGRRQILRAVDTDRVVQGWARVATGRETCAFCLMLISRGPVYRSAEGAGLDAVDVTAQELFERGDDEALAELMDDWHEGCDCRVVPVFDRASWPGRDAYQRAEDIWKTYSRMVDNDPKLWIPRNGNQRGPNDRTWSRSEAVMAAIRRAFYNGEIDMSDYAIAA